MIYRIGGSVFNEDTSSLVDRLLITFPNLVHRPRIFGYDMKVIGNDLELHINTLNEKEFFLEGEYSGNWPDFLELIESLKETLLSLDLNFDIWYCEEDEEGSQLSEEVIFFNNHSTSG